MAEKDTKKGRATIKDVAELAQTSVAIVSRVLGDSGYGVTAQLRKRVLAAAEALSYVPSAAAQKLRGGGSRDIGLVIPNITNPFYMQTIQGISAVCYDRNYHIILCNSARSVERERAFLEQLYARQVQGVILSSADEEHSSVADFLARGMKFVQLDQRFEREECACINYDSELGARMAVRHLAEKGHRRIAFASTPLTRWTRKAVLKGYREEMAEQGFQEEAAGLVFISEPVEAVESGSYEMDAGCSVAQQILERRADVTAVFCVNDMVAFGVIAELRRSGVRIPEDLSVVGFDGIPFAESFMPPITTIRCPSYETGRLAAMMLIDQLGDGSKSLNLNMSLQPILIERQSVRDLRGQAE